MKSILKINSICLFLFSMISCVGPYTLKEIAKSKFNFLDSCQTFTIDNNKILILSEINGNADTVEFDSGLFATIVKFSDKNTAGITARYHKKTQTPAGEEPLEYGKYVSNIANSIWKFDNYPGVESFIDRSICNRLPNKMIGYTAISLNSRFLFCLTFSSNSICYSSSKGPNIPEGYHEVKSSVEKTGLYIYIHVKGKVYKFLFDTGFDSSILLAGANPLSSTTLKPVVYEGDLFSTVFGKAPATYSVYQSVPVGLDFGTPQKIDIVWSDKIKMNLVGIGFLKMFDWIIDSKNQKVYAREINNYVGYTGFKRMDKDYIFDVIESKLQIVLKKNTAENNWPLFKSIRSVNGIEINSGNVCSYKDLLNEQASLKDMRIDFSN